MNETTILLGVELDPASLANVQSEIDNLTKGKSNNIQLNFDDKSISTKLSTIKTDLSEIAKTHVIDIQINQTALDNLQSVIDNLNQAIANLGNLGGGLGNNGGGNGRGGRGGGSNNLPLWNQVAGMQKYRDEMERQIARYEQSLRDSGATNIRTSLQARYDSNGDPSYRSLITYQNELGRTTQAVLELDRATNEFRVSSTNMTNDYRVQTNTFERAQTLITNAEAELARIERATFTGSQALTGDYATRAQAQIDSVRQSFADLRQTAQRSVTDAANVTRDDLSNTIKNLKTELNSLQKLEYPSDKLAAKSVDVLKSEYSDKISQFRDQLKEAGLESSNFSTRLQQLETSLASVGNVNGTGTPWAEWKNQFEQLEGEFSRFGSTIDGMALKLSQSIDTNQLGQIRELYNTLSNLPSNLSGAGVDNLKNSLTELGTQYTELMTNLQSGNLTKDQFTELSQGVKQLDDQLKQVASSAKVFQDGFKNEQSLAKFEANVENLSLKIERLRQKYDEFVQANPGSASADIENKFANIANSMQNIDPTNISNVTAEVRNLGTAVNNTVNPTQTLSQALSQNFGGVGQYLSRFVSATYIIQKTIKTIKSMVNEVKSLDTSLMELQKVTPLSGDSLTEFTDKAYKVGEGLGRTGKDVIDAVTTFSRAGYDLNQATELAKSALVMSNVGVDIPDMASAASDMISIMKAYDIQAENSMAVIDKLYNVANKEPLDFGNITDMLVTAGGTLAQTNTTLEQSMGLLTGGFATLRDNSVANG